MLNPATAAIAEATSAVLGSAFSLEDRDEYGRIGEHSGLFSSPIDVSALLTGGVLAAHTADGDLR